MAIESGEAQFTDRTLVVSGGSRGIGLAIALGAAKLGANVVLLAKTAEPHPKLPGTVHTAVAEVEAAGGKGLAVVGDVRKEEDVQRAVDAASNDFGGVDIVVNNASAISTEPHRGSVRQEVRPDDGHQRPRHVPAHQGGAAAPAKSGNAHVLTISPPLNTEPVLARRAPVVHAVQVRDDAAVAWAGPPSTPGRESDSAACGHRPTSRRRR